MAIDQDRPRIPEVAVSASAAIGGVAAGVMIMYLTALFV